MESRYNLIDEPWIPMAGQGKISLKTLFSSNSNNVLGGNPIEKIAVVKLLLAIAQAAATPANNDEWQALGAKGLAAHCLAYLEQWHAHFYLYGDKPFLQVPAINAAEVKSFGTVLPDIASGNTTVRIHNELERQLDDADKALMLVMLMGFALGGKKTDNKVVLTPGYKGKSNDKGKPSSGKAGPAVCHMGLLHSFLLAPSLLETLWLNLLTREQISSLSRYPGGVGVAPWEQMPAGEDDIIAQRLKQSLMGRLVPVSRFCLLADGGLHYSEGIAHPDYMDGVIDPTVSADFSAKKAKMLWVNPEKRPWRELTSLLSFLDQQAVRGFECLQLKVCLSRACERAEVIAVWSGGLRVSSNAGEQYVSGSDDFLMSEFWLESRVVDSFWFAQLQQEMNALDELAKRLYGRVMGYFKEQLVDGKNLATSATNIFWQLCENDFQDLLNHCEQTEISKQARKKLRQKFARYALTAYDQVCPNHTARQLDHWAENRPNFSNYLKQEA